MEELSSEEHIKYQEDELSATEVGSPAPSLLFQMLLLRRKQPVFACYQRRFSFVYCVLPHIKYSAGPESSWLSQLRFPWNSATMLPCPFPRNHIRGRIVPHKSPCPVQPSPNRHGHNHWCELAHLSHCPSARIGPGSGKHGWKKGKIQAVSPSVSLKWHRELLWRDMYYAFNIYLVHKESLKYWRH